VNVISVQKLISLIKLLPQSLLLSAKVWIGCVWLRTVH